MTDAYFDMMALGNTLKAGWLELRLATWFGRTMQTKDPQGMVVTTSLWRGRLYFIDFREADQQETRG